MAFRTFSEPILVEPARAGAATRSYTADESIKQGQVVKEGPTGEQVSPSDSDGERVIGVALFDASEGEEVTVAVSGTVARLTSGTGSISAGDPIASHGASGEEGEVDTAASGDYIMGRARFDDEGTNDNVEVELEPEGFSYGGSVA